MDRYVGRVIELLKIYGIYDRTMIIIAGDHGEAFGEKVEQGHGIFLYEMSVRVPLIIVAPGLPAGLVIEPEVQLIDIAPTVLDFLGLKSSQMFDGQSLQPVLAGKKLRRADIYLETFFPRENYGWSELIGLICGEWKYLQAPRPELYNLKDDPEENNNLFSVKGDKARQLRTRLENLIKAAVGTASSKRQLTPEEQERLRSLGYIQLAGKEKAAVLSDPKDKLEELEHYQKAYDFETKGNLEAAEEAFAQLLKIAPHLESSYINLARIQGNRKNYQAALATLQQGLEEIPGSDLLLSKLGQTYLLMDRKPEALRAIDKALSINPGNYEALVISVMIYESAGKPDEALKFIERALLIEPENEFLRLARAENLARCNRWQEASEVYRGLTRDFPDNDFYALNAAVVHNLLKEYDQAIEILEKLVTRKPSPKAYLNLVIAYLETKHFPEAVRALELYLADTRGEDPENVARARDELDRLKSLRQ
jgi:tetratricopeptide (TPR) repeat protein